MPFSYTTIKVTRSRIDKGLLAIPVSLIDLFPKTNGDVYLLDANGQWVRTTFTAYNSSSKECRIGGMRDFYDKYHIEGGDELVLHVHGDNRYQIVPEKLFRHEVRKLESRLDKAPTLMEADAVLTALAGLTNTRAEDVIKSEYARLASRTVPHRKVKTRRDAKIREHIPPSLRKMLTSLYHGRCQVSGFSFLKKTGGPYFEVHHIDALKGNHVKNVLVVSPNVHAQFTHAAVKQSFDQFGWLRQVRLNDDSYTVFQVVDELTTVHKKEIHSM